MMLSGVSTEASAIPDASDVMDASKAAPAKRSYDTTMATFDHERALHDAVVPPPHEPVMVVTFTAPLWLKLRRALETHGPSEAAEGAAAEHARAAREEAADALVTNRGAILLDVTNPTPRSQPELIRVKRGGHSAFYADEAMREVAWRLLGVRDSDFYAEPLTPRAAAVRITACQYLSDRIQSSADEKPGRASDLSPEAAMALRAVLSEVKHEACALPWDPSSEAKPPPATPFVVGKLEEALTAAPPLWAKIRALLRHQAGPVPMTEELRDETYEALEANAREEAVRKLLTNREMILLDVINPSPSTQACLRRPAVHDVQHVDQALREAALRLLSDRPGAKALEEQLDPVSPAQPLAWVDTSKYLSARVQSTQEEKPGRQPDMSPAAARALKIALRDVAAKAHTHWSRPV
jgi:hypothetical protein